MADPARHARLGRASRASGFGHRTDVVALDRPRLLATLGSGII